VVVALVVLCGQAVATVHAAATPHVTCLEHGDSVHLAVARTTGPAPSVANVANVANVDRTAVTASTEVSEAHAHEHCGLRAQRVTASDAPVIDSTTALPEPDALLAIVVATPPGHLLLLAPKTSPPPAPVA
jgi:hypothetical protein